MWRSLFLAIAAAIAAAVSTAVAAAVTAAVSAAIAAATTAAVSTAAVATTIAAAVAAAAFVAVTVPYWLYDPGAFTPLQTNNPFAHFRSMLPLSTILVPGACGLVALGLSLKRNGGDQFVLLRDCAVVLALPVVCITLLEIIANGAINYYWLSYAEGLLFFGVLAWWIHFTGASEPQTRINGGQS
ncbi:hypothetical protein LCGC14_0763100 [marine sediment metagenome]|uniref:Uncharacterized protein n=1 Tax=marine sediment metagenome TaxID=412755 RepID=A0A0F9QKC7_9ZZZZ